MKTLPPTQVRDHLEELPGWRKRGVSIRRTFELTDFVKAVKFVNQVAKLAEKANHHPDIDIRWNKVTLTLSTHSEGGLTGKDFALAAKIDRAFTRSVAKENR